MDSLIPTDEESQQDLGKVYSCTCGGGGDVFTEGVCPLQPDSWVQFTVKGDGSDEEPAYVTFSCEQAFRPRAGEWGSNRTPPGWGVGDRGLGGGGGEV